MPETTSGGMRISYDDAGTGEPALLFLPGWCGSRRVFTQLATQCAAQRRTLVLDWRGHGQSETPNGDFGASALVDDALAVIAASGAKRVVPVALSHAGWVAIELHRRLGSQVGKLVLLDWILFEAPPPFLEALQALQDSMRWQQTREQLFAMWIGGLAIPELSYYVGEDMGSYGFDMWSRAGREISAAYAQAISPLHALATLKPPVSVLHLYAQPDSPDYLAAQQAFSAEQPWFQVRTMPARSHFPMLEAPNEMAAAIEEFISASP